VAAATIKESRGGNTRTCPGKGMGKGRRMHEGGGSFFLIHLEK